MIITPATRNQPGLADLPSELKKHIVNQVHDSIVEGTASRTSPASREQATRAAARGLAKLNLVNRDLRHVATQVMNEHPDVCMAATRMAIRKMTGGNQFRQRFVRLVQSHTHIEVPLNQLSAHERKIVLEELSRKDVTEHLEKVKLDLNGVELNASQEPENQESLFQQFLTTIDAMSQQGNPCLNIDLELGNTAMSARGVTTLAEMLRQCKVSSLSLSVNGIRDAGVSVSAIAEALPHSQLTRLAFNDYITDAGAIAIAEALPHSKLTDLDLSFNKIGDAGVSAIANALPHSKLTDLDLSNNDIGEAGASAIGDALSQSQLATLDLSSNDIGEAGAIAIARALPQSKLASLDFRSNNIGDEGAIAIARALPQSKLASLDLSYNKIGDEGAIAIADALPQSKLASLDLSYNKIRNKGTLAIVDAQLKSKLTELDLSCDKLDPPISALITRRISQQGTNPPTVYLWW